MKICFPVRKQNGSEYTTLDEMMGLIGREPHGSWLAGANCLWHGGIHVSAVSAPGSVLTPDNVETAVPLQCMAKGAVVAWRLNKDYLTADYNGKELRYSTTFVLVKFICKPDPEKENSWLEFYSLYMGLGPLSAFPKGKCFKAKTTVAQRKADKFESSASADGVSFAPTKSGQIKKDQRIIVLQEKQFRNGDKAQPFGLAKKLNRDGQAEGNTFWVTVMPEYMEPDGEQYLQMPVWMQKAVAHGKFDEVVKPPTTLGIEAGDAIGFLGEDIAPVGKSNVDSCHYAHIEVISTDPRMSNFLNNPAQVTHGKKYIQVLSGKSLYQKIGEGKDSTFKSMSCIVLKDGGIILPRDKCNPLEDKDGKTWFEISPHSWIAQADVKELYQYDLKELGFTTLEEDPSPDVSKSMSESWVKGAFDWFSKQLGQERGIQQKQVSTFYNNLVKKIDADGDGEITGKELYNAVHHPEMGVRDIAARLIVKHDSEWFGGSSHHRWSVFFQNYDPLRIVYAKKWLDDMEWMSKVDAFKSGAPVWHFHPVMFLGSLRESKKKGWAHSLFAELLGRVESKNDYSAYNVTKTGKSVPHYNSKLTTMSLSEVMEAQRERNMFATGRFQIIPNTLKGAVSALNLDTSELYNESIQDRIFEDFLIKIKRPAFIKYLEGNGSVEDAIYDWAKEFASAGVRKGKPISPKREVIKDEEGKPVLEHGKKKYKIIPRAAQVEGESYYAGDGLNKAHILPNEMVRVLEESKNAS